MEQSKVMEYRSWKMSPDILKPRNIYIYIYINDFRKGCQPRTDIVKDEKVIWLQTPTVFWLDGGTISLSY